MQPAPLPRTRRRARPTVFLLGLVVTSLTLPASVGVGAAATRPKVVGTANVAYAGSLAPLNEKTVGPAFTAATGAGYDGRGAGSTQLSAEIASGEISPNVFESVGGAPITALEPRFTRWYVQFAASQIVVAYNPTGRFASTFRAIARHQLSIRRLFSLLESPGLRLGRTDPNLDPQGVGFIEMLELAQRSEHLASGTVAKILGTSTFGSSSSSEIFEETALDPRLQAGQLDAASAYLSQAKSFHLPYITLPSAINLGYPADASAYAKASVRLTNGTVKHGEPLTINITTIGTTDRAAADAFAAYVLSATGLGEFREAGYTMLIPRLFGARSAVPASVKSDL